MFFGEDYDLEGNIGVIEERGDERRWELVIRGEKELRHLGQNFQQTRSAQATPLGGREKRTPAGAGKVRDYRVLPICAGSRQRRLMPHGPI